MLHCPTRPVLLLLPLLVGCGGGLFNIRISDEATTTVGKGTIVEDFVGNMGFSDFIQMDLTDAAELQNQGVEPGDISEVELEMFELEAVAPEGADLAFLSAITLSVEAPDLPDVVVASADDFPEGQALVPLTLEDVDLTEYVVSESMTFTTDVSGNRPAEDTDVTARFTVRVRVTGQGVRNQARSD